MDERTDQKRTGTPDRRAVAPYGAWRSPVTARLIAEGGVGIMWPQSVDESLYWTELRPLEDGRYVVVRRAPDGEIADVTPEGVSARTLVHEYGGGMYGRLPRRARRRERHLQRPGRPAPVPAGPAAGRRRPARRPAGGRSRAGHLDRPPAHHPGAAVGPRPPLRRRARHAGRPPARERARAARGRRRGGQRAREPPHRRIGRASRHRLRPRLLRGAAAQPGRAPRRLALVGPPRHAVGRHRAVDGGARRRRRRHRRAARRRRAGRVDPAAALEPIRRALVRERPHRLVEPLRGGSDPADGDLGGTSAGGRPEPCPLVTRAAEFASVPWVFGLQSYVFLSDGRLLVCFTEDGRDHLAVLDAPEAGASAAGPRPDRPPTRPTSPRCCASSTRPTPSSPR